MYIPEPMIMYKPNKNKGINRYLLEAREKFNATLVPTDETGIRAIFKHLKARWLNCYFTRSFTQAFWRHLCRFFLGKRPYPSRSFLS